MTEDKPFRNIQDYYALQAYAVAEPEEFWGNLATETLTWSQPFKTVLNESSPPFYKWFEGGKLMPLSSVLTDTYLLVRVSRRLSGNLRLAIYKLSTTATYQSQLTSLPIYLPMT